jgi:hypothetical protein
MPESLLVKPLNKQMARLISMLALFQAREAVPICIFRSMRPRYLLSFAVWIGVSLLSGCGPTLDQPFAAAVPTPTDINHNWLLTGSLPVLGTTVPGTGEQLNLAVTLSTNGTQLSGFGTYTENCAGLTGAAGFPISGSIDSTGVFTATAGEQNPGVSLSFTGTAPTKSEGTWSGTYTYVNPGCSTPISGKYTATALGTLTGTYTGSTSLAPTYSPLIGTPVTITVQLQQGTVVPPPNGTNEYYPYALTGTISVSGASCFHTGTFASVDMYDTDIAGNNFTLVFNMDDGSQYTMGGQFTDIAANTLYFGESRAIGGSCTDVVSQSFTLSR